MQSRTFGKIKLSIICPETSISSLSERGSGIMLAMIGGPVGKRPVAANGGVKVRDGPRSATPGPVGQDAFRRARQRTIIGPAVASKLSLKSLK